MRSCVKAPLAAEGGPGDGDHRLSRQAGFTLLEIFVGLCIMGCILMVALPSFANLLGRNRLDATSSTLAKEIILARTRAIQHHQEVTFQFDIDEGSYTFSPGGPTRVLAAGIELADAADFTFDSRGLIAAGCQAFELRQGERTHTIKVSSAGRVRVVR